MTRKFSLGVDVDLALTSRKCAPQLTGADLYALCADAWMEALKRRIRADEGEAAEGEEQGGGGTAAGGSRGDANDDEDFYSDGHAAAAGPSAGSSDSTAAHAGAMPLDITRAEDGSAASSATAGVISVTQADFDTALQNLVPSLSLDDVRKYERLRDHYQGVGPDRGAGAAW